MEPGSSDPDLRPSLTTSLQDGRIPGSGGWNESNQVGWDGDGDPANPVNWSGTKKTVNVGIVSIMAFIPPLTSSIITPAVPLIMSAFNTTNDTEGSLCVSIFVLGFAFGPLLLSPLSELYGRRIVYNISNIVFLAFTIACAVAPTMASFIFFRFMAGCVGGGPMNIGGGTIADCILPASRGRIMSVFYMGIFLGPVLGPLIGGFLAQAAGWRWTLWIVEIMSGTMTVITFFFLAESHGPTLLAAKLKKTRKETENRNFVARKNGVADAKTVFLRAILRPSRMLLQSPIVTGLSIYLAVIYAYGYLLFTTFSTVFPGQYGFDTGVLGLAFLGLGVGMMIALLALGSFSDKIQERLAVRHGEPKLEFHLLPLIFGAPFLPAGLFIYGWTAELKVHWIVPILATGLIGIGFILSFVPTQIYMVEAFTQYAASALAATSVVRSIVGGILPIAGISMYKAMGYGWGNSLLGFIALALSIMPLVFYKHGGALRKRYAVNFD